MINAAMSTFGAVGESEREGEEGAAVVSVVKSWRVRPPCGMGGIESDGRAAASDVDWNPEGAEVRYEGEI